jgi:hypothetical protein
MDGPSIHDNLLVGYEVDAEQRRIVLHTRFEERSPVEHTDVLFEGVSAYRFEGDNFENILFGIDEVPLAHLLSKERALFEQGKEYAWPGLWNTSMDASLTHLRAEGAKGFEISSSLGMNGWVIARSCRFVSVPARSRE